MFVLHISSIDLQKDENEYSYLKYGIMLQKFEFKTDFNLLSARNKYD